MTSSGNTKQAVVVVAVIFGAAIGTIWYVSFIGASVSSTTHKDNFIITANGERRQSDVEHEVQRQQRNHEDSVNYTEERKSIIDCEFMDPPELQMPKFLGSMPNITASKGENVSMTCVVENLGMYKMAWLKLHSQTILTIHNHIITKNRRFDLSIDSQTLETPCKNRTIETTITMYTLYINEVQENDEGHYMCQMNTDPMKGQWGFLRLGVPAIVLEEE